MAASRELHAGASSYRRPSADLMGNKDWLPVCASAFTANASGGALFDVRHPSVPCVCTTYASGCMRNTTGAERSQYRSHLHRDWSAKRHLRAHALMVMGMGMGCGWQVAGLKPGTQYVFRARLRNILGFSQWGYHRCHSLHRDWAHPGHNLQLDWAHPCHICTGTGLTPATICTGIGLTPATSAPGLGSAPWNPPLQFSASDCPITQ